MLGYLRYLAAHQTVALKQSTALGKRSMGSDVRQNDPLFHWRSEVTIDELGRWSQQTLQTRIFNRLAELKPCYDQ